MLRPTTFLFSAQIKFHVPSPFHLQIRILRLLLRVKYGATVRFVVPRGSMVGHASVRQTS